MRWEGAAPASPGIYARIDGAYRPVDATHLVFVADDGREVTAMFGRSELGLGVSLVARFAGPGGDASGERGGRAMVFGHLVLYPGSGSHVWIDVEARAREDGSLVAGGKGSAAFAAYGVKAERRTRVEAETLLMVHNDMTAYTVLLQAANDREVPPFSPIGLLGALVADADTSAMAASEDLGEMREAHRRLQTRIIAVDFGGCNVVNVRIPISPDLRDKVDE